MADGELLGTSREMTCRMKLSGKKVRKERRSPPGVAGEGIRLDDEHSNDMTSEKKRWRSVVAELGGEGPTVSTNRKN
jgi:hypothetical protein